MIYIRWFDGVNGNPKRQEKVKNFVNQIMDSFNFEIKGLY